MHSNSRSPCRTTTCSSIPPHLGRSETFSRYFSSLSSNTRIKDTVRLISMLVSQLRRQFARILIKRLLSYSANSRTVILGTWSYRLFCLPHSLGTARPNLTNKTSFRHQRPCIYQTCSKTRIISELCPRHSKFRQVAAFSLLINLHRYKTTHKILFGRRLWPQSCPK